MAHRWKGLHFLISMLPANCQLGSANKLSTSSKVSLQAKLVRPPCFWAELSAAGRALCTPLTQSTFQSPATSSPVFGHATSAASRWRAVPTPSPAHKSRVICVSFTFESHPHIHTTGISEKKIRFLHFPADTALCMTTGEGNSERNFSFRRRE